MSDSSTQNKRQRVTKPYAKGAIYGIKLHNFMSYRHAEITDPGPYLNCIIGPNGTGKSSIVCAMCVGLGGSLKVTERGDKIGTCVHGNGCAKDEQGAFIRSGYVQMELWEGSGPNQNLVVRLDFDIDNKSSWTLNGQSSTLKRVKEIMESLNIQVDNPLQFLPQDKVGQFSSMSPIELLKHTEMAIGPEVYRKHEALIVADKELKAMKVSWQTEEKELDKLQKQNEVLKADVERWQRYQENLQRLAHLQGKFYWVEWMQRKEDFEQMHEQYAARKSEIAELQTELKRRQKEQAPLKKLHELSKESQKQMKTLFDKKNGQRERLSQELEEGEKTIGDLRHNLRGVDRTKSNLQHKLRSLEQQLTDGQAQLETLEREVQHEFKQPLDQVMKTAKQDLHSACQEVASQEDALLNTQESQSIAQRDVDRANRALQQLSSIESLKMRNVMQRAPDAAKLGAWVDQCDVVQQGKDVLGPLMMSFDIPDPLHAHLAEQVVNNKHIFSFLARSDAAKRALSTRCKEQRLNVNVYMFDKGFAPMQRPGSHELARFGVTAWLDEALQVAPEQRGIVLGALKELMSVDGFLLCTEQTNSCVGELQAFLAERGVSSARIVTPSRIYSTTRSRHGQRNLISTSRPTRQGSGLFKTAVDPKQRQQLEQSLETAQAKLAKVDEQRSGLQHNLELATQAVKTAQDRLKVFQQKQNGLISARERIKPILQRRDTARKEVACFDADAKKAEYRAALKSHHQQLMGLLGSMATSLCDSEAARLRLNSARLAAKAAEFALEEAEQGSEELKRKISHGEVDVRDLKNRTATIRGQVNELEHRANEKAGDLKPCEERSAAATALWESLPSDPVELESEMDSLESETSNETADGNSVKEFQARQRKIDACKATLATTGAACDAKEAELKGLEDQWKPALRDMIETVDSSFASYFRRFNCMGSVSLSDGRKLDDQGEPVGDDDFATYKLHIKVKWRESEELHVLGQDGRDSGGERSVATMVYLISLQNINPAPFRVVDEINQAMDSTNERNIFDCITSACRDMGKQYFLLTPKLLPDLDYGENAVMQLVFNGPYMPSANKFNLSSFC